MNPTQTEDFIRKQAEAVERAKVVKSRMSPAGALALPELLDKRRLHYGIPDGAFSGMCLFDRVYIAQVDDGEETFGDTTIIMPDKVRARENAQAPRGVIVNAGLLALDQLRTNGSDLGHVVHFVKASIWRRVVDVVDGKEIDVIVLRVGDITADEDLEKARRAGTIRLEWDEDQQKHHWLTKDGRRLSPQSAWVPDDV